MVLYGAAAKVLESRGIVLVDTHALRVHVAQVREGGRLAGGGRLGIILEGLGGVRRQPARAVVVQMAESELSVDGALER